MKKISVLFAIVIATLMTACGGDKVDNGRLEEMRSIAKENAEYNAQMYRAANPRFTGDYSIVARSDDGQTKTCPQGDGWAAVSIMKVDGKAVDKTPLMCSTFSSSVGCYREEDFNKNPNLSKQNSGCSSEAPYPLPALRK